MGYEIQALIGHEAIVRELATRHAAFKVVPLRSGFALIPLTTEIADSVGGNSTGPFQRLSDVIEGIAKDSSRQGSIAYIEADFFGGVGSQRAVAWEDGITVFEEFDTQDAINKALRMLGVPQPAAGDEFDELGLSRNRFTEDWLDSQSEGGE